MLLFKDVTQDLYRNCARDWALNAYHFDRYQKNSPSKPILFLPDFLDKQALFAEIEAIFLVRDLINTPTEALNTDHFSDKIKQISKKYGARYRVISGQRLLKQNYPAIHSVGRASASEPKLVHLSWGDPSDPKVTLVGKGVCFDTGGLNIKTGQGMVLMKKDMGGAAHALALAQWIMQLRRPMYLNVYLPLVENSISSNAIRPGDVITTRKGLSIEITNTDAEGRLILADALTRACEDPPDCLIDFATLTGAARVAIGPDVPALFSNQVAAAQQLQRIGQRIGDPVWQLPLHIPYKKMLDSNIADLNNSPNTSYAGAITAALFLQAFVPSDVLWIHLDLMGWNLESRPGHPEGGEAQGLRSVFTYLEKCVLG